MKVSKFIYSAVICLTAVTGLSSCGDEWLDRQPSDGIDASTAITTTASLASARVGLYSALKGRSSDYVDYYGANMFVYGDVRGEDVQYNASYGSSRGEFYYKMEYKTADDFTSKNSVWRTPLIVLGRANRIIEAANGGVITDQDKNKEAVAQYENEAKVIRAMAMFDLTRVYGKPYLQDNGASYGAPMATTSMEPATQVGRATVAECYTQIIKDLTSAIASGALSTKATPGYINAWAAKALLVRVYLTKGDYNNALSTAEDIIKNSPYALWTSAEYANAWQKDDKAHANEMLFELAISGTSDWTDREGIAYLLTENTDAEKVAAGYGDLIVTKTFADALASDPKDVRNNILLKATSSSELKAKTFEGRAVYINKYPAPAGSVEVRMNNIPLLRLSEVYLSAAEAAFKANKKDKAAEYLNAIIKNRTTDTGKQVTAADVTEDRIYMERRKELVGEGQRYFDALRRGEKIVRYTNADNRGWHSVLNADAQTIDTWKSKKELPLIPQSEIDANPKMEQNPTY
ncbi:SusD family protein [Prevotella sp. DNF00663]|uniref:RagB/SusD family nutrient uptake outer membrane protein n=1 Tax=unclassified Prevotella TaxID=2638335 RepID=UPI0005130E18|nr:MULTISPECIES: RagB/SusD family nutrient uptake outer membrane protein [unclassified Prevotella]KGI61397.1 membrane protein [Prevotella sp. S7 MS 2]KXB80289.1 SusD family protein [Prevotella sp. DNF00663]